MEHPAKCYASKCPERAETKGLCGKHYKRLQRYNDVERNLRPKAEGYSRNHDHPLYNKWRSITRRNCGKEIILEWKSFQQFINDVESAPSPEHSFRRLDKSKPYGPGNYYWCAPVDRSVEYRERMNERQRKLRELNPSLNFRSRLKRQYGINLEEYNQMLEQQGGVCKICGQVDNRNRYRLSVDHCHSTGRVRGLLCSGCNTLIGMARDSVEILQKAIEYLK